ncbi:hypothetical protein AZKH_0935 [Azoarcus sp. KH32C]|nr:hypothetical protein AZKH_0935 [Azoarcus sp. KH32C]
MRYESNLYRLSDGEAAPEGRKSDTVSETGLGLKFDRVYGRQHLLADLDFVSARYAIHKDLNHDSPDALLSWDWALGNRWSGVLSYLYRESLTGFDEAGGTTPSLNQYSRAQATADYWFHPSWAVGLGFAHTRNRFDGFERDVAEYDADTVDANLTYRPATGNRLVLTLRDTEGQYPNRPAVEESIRDYRQQEVRLGGDWQLTGATRLSGFIGRTRVDYRLAPDRDFTGTIGRLAVIWEPTVKTSLTAAVRREIGAQQDLAANYAVTEAISVSPRWKVSDKVTLGAGMEWRRRDFRGEPLGGDSTQARPTDRSRRYGLTAEYKPLRALSVALGLQRQVRDGSNQVGGYAANIADLSLHFQF